MADSQKLGDDACGRDPIWDRKIETQSIDEEWQIADAAWRELAKGLIGRCPFYAGHYKSAGVSLSDIESLDDLRFLPFVEKSDTRISQEESPPFGAYLGVERQLVKKVFQTSGSSGRPSLIALTESDRHTWTTIGARSYYAAGVHPHNSVLTTFGAGPFVAGHTHDTLDRLGATRLPVAPGDTERVISAIELGLVDTLLATPSFVLHLADVMEGRGTDSGALRHVVVGGEPGGGIPAIRERIESALGVNVREASGIGDISPSLYGECSNQTGMHFSGQGLVWVELLDPSTEEPVDIRRGAQGELVYTTLVREAMPMVRFRSHDLAEIVDTSCDCGRTSFKIRIHGRSDDMLIVRGVNVYPSAIQAIVAEFQTYVTGRARIVLPPGSGVSVEPPVLVEAEVVVIPENSQLLATQIENAIRARLKLRASVVLIPRLEFGESGYKTPLTIRRPPIKGDT